MGTESGDQDRIEGANRRRFLKAIGVLGVVGLAGCGGDDTESPEETGTDGDGTESPEETGADGTETNTDGTDTPTETDGEETPTDTDTPEETETETPAQDVPDDPPTVVSLGGGGAVESGGTATLTVTVENPYLFPMQSVEVSLEAQDDGWTVEATGETSLGTIEATGSAAVSWEVTAPADADSGVTLTGTVSYATNTDSAEAQFSRSITVFEPGEVPQDGLEAYYSLDGDTATNAITGTDALENGSPTPGVEGVVGSGFGFETSGTTGADSPAENDGLQSGEDLPLNDGGGTIGAWVNVAGHDDYGRLYQVGGAFGTVPDSGWQTRFDQANDAILIETRGGSVTEIAATPALETDTWYYVVTVMQEGEGRIHLFDQDGELSESPWTGDPVDWETSGSDPLFLMTGGYDEGTNGTMDEVRGYSRALTEGEVLELYAGSGGSV